MREHVVGDEQVCLAALGRQASRQLSAEEVDDGLDPTLPRHRGYVRGRLDAERWHAPLDDVLEQVTVVAGQLHHEAIRIEPEALKCYST